MINRPAITERKILTEEHFPIYYERLQKTITLLKDGANQNLYVKTRSCDKLLIHKLVKNIIHKEEAYDLLRKYIELGTLHFERSFTTSSDFSFVFDEQEYNVTPILPDYHITPFNWFNLFTRAMLTRSLDVIKRLIALQNYIPLKFGFWHFGSQFLVGLYNEQPDVIYNCINKMQTLAKAGATVLITTQGKKRHKSAESGEILTKLWYPIFRLYELAYFKKEDLFNEELLDFLKSKKQYIEKKGKSDDPSMWIDFPLLGCLAYAYDRGMNINIKSDYVPEWLYRMEDPDLRNHSS